MAVAVPSLDRASMRVDPEMLMLSWPACVVAAAVEGLEDEVPEDVFDRTAVFGGCTAGRSANRCAGRPSLAMPRG